METVMLLLNGSWPLMIDGLMVLLLSNSQVEWRIVSLYRLCGFIVAWHSSTMNPIDIEKSVDVANSGGGELHSSSCNCQVFGVPSLLLLGLPKERIEAPETVMIPAAGWLGTTVLPRLASQFGRCPLPSWALDRCSIWIWVQAVLIGWLCWQTLPC